MALSTLGWINGITVSILFLFTTTFGLFCIYQSKKSNAKLLSYFGFAGICAGLAWVGNFIDFLTILSTGDNVDNSNGFVYIISNIWLGPGYCLVIIIAVEILNLKRKKYIIFIHIVLGILYIILILLDPNNTITYIYPSQSGEDLIEDNVVLESPAGILMLFLAFSFLIFSVIGTLIKGIQSEGVLRKKFLIFSTGGFLFTFAGILDQLGTPGFFLIIIRLVFIFSYFLYYLGVREEPEKKILPGKKVKVEGDLFRISQFERGEITEEEVSVYRDQAICLVCKGQVIRYSYICPNCKALYCANCAQSLTKLENVCWVCDTPFDESKPSKPFKKEEPTEIEVLEQEGKKIKK